MFKALYDFDFFFGPSYAAFYHVFACVAAPLISILIAYSNSFPTAMTVRVLKSMLPGPEHEAVIDRGVVVSWILSALLAFGFLVLVLWVWPLSIPYYIIRACRCRKSAQNTRRKA